MKRLSGGDHQVQRQCRGAQATSTEYVFSSTMAQKEFRPIQALKGSAKPIYILAVVSSLM